MTTAAPSTALATIQPAFTDPERLALAGYLAGYRGLTREDYTLDLRQFTTWCRARSVPLFAVRRADIESFARDLEARGRARSTVTRRLCTIAGFYRYAVEEELLDHSRRLTSADSGWTTSRTPSPWTATNSARYWSPPARPAARTCADLPARPERAARVRGRRRRHRAAGPGTRAPDADHHPQGRKVVTIPLAPRTARAIDLAIGERTDGPVFLAADGRRLDRHGAGRIVRKTARRAGISKTVTPHTLRHAFITAAQMGNVASSASFSGLREHVLPAVQRKAPRRFQRDGARSNTSDLRCQQPVAPAARMRHLIRLQEVTACCGQGNVQERSEYRGSIRPITG
jgi:integrase/recombinase XerD